MPALTITKKVTYTDNESGTSFALASSKTKQGRLAYRQVMTCIAGVDRRLIKIADLPNYAKMVYFNLINKGPYDIYLAVVSGGGRISVIVPAGRTFDVFNTNYWNDDSAFDPDTITEIIGVGIGGDATVKFDAIFA